MAPNRFDATLEQDAVTGDWLHVRRNAERFTFDSSGRLKSVGDRNGYTTLLAYDGSTGLLATVTDAAGRTLTFT